MNEKVKEYSDEVLNEQKEIFYTSPKDDIDWAIVMYLFKHSNPHYGALFEERNVITVGKVCKYFDLEYDDVYKRLRRMIWWVDVNAVYGYYKSFNICSITNIGIKAVMKSLEIFEIEDKKERKRC